MGIYRQFACKTLLPLCKRQTSEHMGTHCQRTVWKLIEQLRSAAFKASSLHSMVKTRHKAQWDKMYVVVRRTLRRPVTTAPLSFPTIISSQLHSSSCPGCRPSDPSRVQFTLKSTLVYPYQTHLATWVTKPSRSRRVMLIHAFKLWVLTSYLST